MRVLITGMGGELGTRVANMLEADAQVDAILGIDLDPPRRRLYRAEFHRVDPRNRERMDEVIRGFEPTALVHIGIYEPYARSSPRAAVARTASGTIAALAAAAEAGSLDRIVVRSGIEVYGRRRGSPVRPDEGVTPDPSTPFGHSLLHAEHVAAETGRALDTPVTLVRFAPLVGPHFPSPLGRLLRLPAVPFSVLADPPFSVTHQEDAAAALVAALHAAVDGPLNVCGPGAVTASQAARLGGRVAVPMVGPVWRSARLLAELAGAPVPEHVSELLLRGRTADGSRAIEVLGLHPPRTTHDVVRHLYEWGEIAYLTTERMEAA